MVLQDFLGSYKESYRSISECQWHSDNTHWHSDRILPRILPRILTGSYQGFLIAEIDFFQLENGVHVPTQRLPIL